MTCVAARLSPAGWLTMASDSRLVAPDGRAYESGEPKIAESPRWGLVGWAGDVAGLQQLGVRIGWQETLDGLARLLRQVDAELLLVRDGRLVTVDYDGGIHWHAEPYGAIGSGAEVAIGALTVGASPARAVAAAIQHHEGCGGRVWTLRRRA